MAARAHACYKAHTHALMTTHSHTNLHAHQHHEHFRLHHVILPPHHVHTNTWYRRGCQLNQARVAGSTVPTQISRFFSDPAIHRRAPSYNLRWARLLFILSSSAHSAFAISRSSVENVPFFLLTWDSEHALTVSHPDCSNRFRDPSHSSIRLAASKIFAEKSFAHVQGSHAEVPGFHNMMMTFIPHVHSIHFVTSSLLC